SSDGLYSVSLHDALPISFLILICNVSHRNGSNLHIFLSRHLEIDIVLITSDEQSVFVYTFHSIIRVFQQFLPPLILLYFPLSFRSEEHTSALQSRFDLVC